MLAVPAAASGPPLALLAPAKAQFQRRLRDPQLGDKVEVAWRGKFRLEALEVYHGLAWWAAEVTEKRPRLDRYRVHYPGWDRRWDEWVHRDRLRWPCFQEGQPEPIGLGDEVEVWCSGNSVPGAWLQATVDRVDGPNAMCARARARSRSGVEERAPPSPLSRYSPARLVRGLAGVTRDRPARRARRAARRARRRRRVGPGGMAGAGAGGGPMALFACVCSMFRIRSCV